MFKVGDKVKWTDPNTKCVMHGTIMRIEGKAAIIKAEGGTIVTVPIGDLQHDS